jgi:hypothetical protein
MLAVLMSTLALPKRARIGFGGKNFFAVMVNEADG